MRLVLPGVGPNAFAISLAVGIVLGSAVGCAGGEARVHGAHTAKTQATAESFLLALIVPSPPTPTGEARALALARAGERRLYSYDSALMALWLMRTGRREDAARVLLGVAALQSEDGAIPFSLELPAPGAPAEAAGTVRSGALAWVGYAATEYLDAERGGAGREAIALMAHRAAGYLLRHQFQSAGDARDGLVLGGSGSVRYEVSGGKVREVYVPGEVAWASTEHNIDAFFFLRELARISDDAGLARAAERIRVALHDRGWMAAGGQLVRGFREGGRDEADALDCASWGALFLLAAGDRPRAETAAAAAIFRYASRDAASGASGHRPYAHSPIFENAGLATFYAPQFPVNDWDRVEGVWPEGSAGVALAALRLGHRKEAIAILDGMEKLRHPSGGMPTCTTVVPFEMDTAPSLASTVWIELVRFEVSRDAGHDVLWRDR